MSMLCMLFVLISLCHHLSIHSTVDGPVGGFQALALMDKAALSFLYMFLLCMCLGVALLGNRLAKVWPWYMSLSTFPPGRACEFQSFHGLANA